MSNRTIVLIHGLWMTAAELGALGRPLPEHAATRCSRRRGRAWTATSTQLARDPSAIEHLGIGEIVDHYDGDHPRTRPRRRSSWATRSAARSREILLDRGLGAAGVGDRRRRRAGLTKLPFSTLRSAFPVAQEPGQQPPRRRADRRAVPLRVHQHADRGGVRRGLRALRGARAGPRPVPGRAGELQPAHAATASTSTTTTGRRCCSSPAVRTTSCPRRSTRRRPTTTASPRPSPSTRSSRAGRTSPSARTGWEEVADYALDWADRARRRSGGRLTRPGRAGPEPCAGLGRRG